MGSSPAVGKVFHFVILAFIAWLTYRISQYKWNQPWHPPSLYPVLKSSLRKFYGRYGDLIKQYEVSLSQMLNDILWPDHIQWQPSTDQTLYRTRPLTEFWVVSIEHLRRVWHADRGRLLLRTPGPVPLGLAYVLLVETNPFPNLSLFYRIMLFEYPSVLSRFCLAREWYYFIMVLFSFKF